MFVKCLVKFDLEFDLKFEISDGKNLVNVFFFGGGGRERISGQSWGKFSETSFQNSRLCPNFVQQKGGANTICKQKTSRDWEITRVSAFLVSID